MGKLNGGESGSRTIPFKQANDGGPARTLRQRCDSDRCYSNPPESQSLLAGFPVPRAGIIPSSCVPWPGGWSRPWAGDGRDGPARLPMPAKRIMHRVHTRNRRLHRGKTAIRMLTIVMAKVRSWAPPSFPRATPFETHSGSLLSLPNASTSAIHPANRSALYRGSPRRPHLPGGTHMRLLVVRGSDASHHPRYGRLPPELAVSSLHRALLLADRNRNHLTFRIGASGGVVRRREVAAGPQDSTSQWTVRKRPGIDTIPGRFPKLVAHRGFEPLISALRGRCPRPLDECAATTTENTTFGFRPSDVRAPGG